MRRLKTDFCSPLYPFGLLLGGVKDDPQIRGRSKRNLSMSLLHCGWASYFLPIPQCRKDAEIRCAAAPPQGHEELMAAISLFPLPIFFSKDLIAITLLIAGDVVAIALRGDE